MLCFTLMIDWIFVHSVDGEQGVRVWVGTAANDERMAN